MKRILGFLAVIVTLAGTSCSTEIERSHLEVWLTDSPGDYEEVNIDIQGVEINRNEGNETTGWVALNVTKGVYNLLHLSNGVDTLLGTADLPSGRLSQVRLVLGTNNTIKIGGEVKPLITPNKFQFLLKVLVQTQMSPGGKYALKLDFDAARSIKDNGDGTYTLKPVIRLVTDVIRGSIEGSVTPVDAMPAIFALIGTDTVSATYADSLGFFYLQSIPAGTYTVTFDSKPGFPNKQVPNVQVTIGNATSLGEVQIN